MHVCMSVFHKVCLEKSFTASHADHLCWSHMAADRDAWRNSIFKDANEFEEDRRDAKKRQEYQQECSSRLKYHRMLLLNMDTSHCSAFSA